MKTSTFKQVFLLMCLFCDSVLSNAQPPADYSFTSPVLLSGTDRAVGAVYRFSTVKPGVDAIVTITNAVNATLAILDQTGQGWNAAFQPNITVPSMQNGYIEFRIDFVTAGTFTILNQAQVAATALDIDGYNFSANQRLYEYEQFDMGANSYVEYEFTGTDINVSFNGTAIRATNVGGVDYGSINLSPNVRFTVFKSGVRTIFVRSGANNQDQFNNVTRQRSFYFARFTYPNSLVLLDVDNLKSFTATALANKTVRLNWELNAGHSIEKIDIERSADNNNFEIIKSVLHGNSTVTDYSAPPGFVYYRLLLHEKNGKRYYSTISKVNTGKKENNAVNVYPAVTTGKVTIDVNSADRGEATVQFVGNSGRLLLNRKMLVKEGENSLTVDLSNLLPQGNFYVIVNTRGRRYVRKLVKVLK